MERSPLEIKETQINSIRTLLGKLESLIQDQDSNYEYYYRGHSNKKYELIPSVYRNSGWITNEHKMFRELVLVVQMIFTS